jgi:hypothetical protein
LAFTDHQVFAWPDWMQLDSMLSAGASKPVEQRAIALAG